MNILKKAFTTSRDGLMPSVFSQLDSKMHGGGEAACHGNAPQLGTRLRTAPPQRVCDVLRKHRQHHVKAGVPQGSSPQGQRMVCRREGRCRDQYRILLLCKRQDGTGRQPMTNRDFPVSHWAFSVTYWDMTNIISQTKKLNTELPQVGKLREVHHFFALFFGLCPLAYSWLAKMSYLCIVIQREWLSETSGRARCP